MTVGRLGSVAESSKASKIEGMVLNHGSLVLVPVLVEHLELMKPIRVIHAQVFNLFLGC